MNADSLLTYTSDNFSVRANLSDGSLYLTMHMHTDFVRTGSCPALQGYLSENLPGILHTPCFNGKNLSFYDEVVNTEVGHLFEHIILEHYSLYSFRQIHVGDMVMKGKTQWDWNKDPEGLFHIYMYADSMDRAVMRDIVKKSINFLEEVIRINYVCTTTKGSLITATS